MQGKSKQTKIRLSINGKGHVLEVSPSETLAELLRERLGLTGTKIGCNRGECGACTVLIEGKAVLSCLTLAVECEGKNILTIEGLCNAETGELDPIQEAFVENFGVQCGFCTPGMVMSAKALLDNNPNPCGEEVKEGIQGNLCRCTGYVQIIESIKAASKKIRRSKA